jgi:hypothetical protein
MVLISCINIVYKLISLKTLLLTVEFVNDRVYWHGTGRISNCLNRLLREVLSYASYTSHDSDGFHV